MTSERSERSEPGTHEDPDGAGDGDELRPEVLFREDLESDVIAIDDHTWAIHGNIPFDREVIIAEFDRPEQAEEVLGSIRSDQPDP